MKALFIGGTGVISTSVVKRLLELGWEVTLLNRGNHAVPQGVRVWQADINDTARVQEFLGNETFDTIADFIVFTPDQARRDLSLFAGKTAQYIFISSASAYQKPVPAVPITEDVPLINPYWQYSRNKAAIEKLLLDAYKTQGFPVTIVRPSHTYSERSLPLQIHGDNGPWQVIKRMQEGKTVPVAADGETLWTVTTSEDFAVYFCGLCGNPDTIGQAYHITSDQALTWNEMYRIIAGDKSNSVIFDNSKVMCVTGIPPIKFTPYSEAAKRSIDYLLSHPEAQKEDPDFDAFCDRAEAAMAAAESVLLEE